MKVVIDVYQNKRTLSFRIELVRWKRFNASAARTTLGANEGGESILNDWCPSTYDTTNGQDNHTNEICLATKVLWHSTNKSGTQLHDVQVSTLLFPCLKVLPIARVPRLLCSREDSKQLRLWCASHCCRTNVKRCTYTCIPVVMRDWKLWELCILVEAWSLTIPWFLEPFISDHARAAMKISIVHKQRQSRMWFVQIRRTASCWVQISSEIRTLLYTANYSLWIPFLLCVTPTSSSFVYYGIKCWFLELHTGEVPTSTETSNLRSYVVIPMKFSKQRLLIYCFRPKPKLNIGQLCFE